MQARHTMCTCGHALGSHKLVERNFRSDGEGGLIEISQEETSRVFVTRRTQPCSGCSCENWTFDTGFVAPEAIVVPSTKTSAGETAFPGMFNLCVSMAKEQLGPTLKARVVIQDGRETIASLTDGERKDWRFQPYPSGFFDCICGHTISLHCGASPMSLEAVTDGRLAVCGVDDCSCKGFKSKLREELHELREEQHEQSAVNHPAHYGGKDNLYEAIKVIEAWGLDFHSGNAVKYISRAGKKDPTKEIEDLEKSVWYLNRRIEWLRSQKP